MGTAASNLESSRARPRLSPAVFLATALVVFSCSWSALYFGFFSRNQIVDTPIYQSYGESMVAGIVPYRTFRVEYPPGALPLFVAPSLGADHRSKDDYRRRFEVLMLLCGCAALAGMTLVLTSLGAGPGALGAALGVAALSPLALGPVIQTRFDLAPAALTVLALAALVRDRPRLGLAVLGLATTVKVFPAVIVPLAVAHVWRRRGRREAGLAVAVFAIVVAAVVGPFAAGASHGLWDTAESQLRRPLQIESLGAAALIATRHITGLSVRVSHGFGSDNLAGTTSDAVARVLTLAQVVALAGVWIWFALRRRTNAELVAASAGAVCAFVAFSKVLSPQFLIWLVPLVPLVRGRRGLAASGLLVAILVLTQTWFPYHYWDYVAFDAWAPWVVLARDVLLVVLAAVLVLPPGLRDQTSTGRRRASHAVARPSTPQSTKSASMRTSPLAG
jgi:hypothetical protein